MKSKIFIGMALTALLTGPVRADSDKQDTAQVMEALRAVQAALQDPARRQEIAQDSEAKAALKKVSEVAGSKANEEKIFQLAASILANLVQQSGGDVQKMNEALQKGSIDPASFINTFTPEQKRQLSDIAVSSHVP